MVSENPLEISPNIGHSNPLFRDFEKASDLIGRPKNVFIDCPLHAEEHNFQLLTNISVKGWGVHLGDQSFIGMLSDKEISLHINLLELKAVFLAVKAFQSNLQNKRVLVASDNATVVSCLNK